MRNISDILGDGRKFINQSEILYCLMDFNCEHFATFLRFGLSFCEQHVDADVLKNLLLDPEYFKKHNFYVNPYEEKALIFRAKRSTEQFQEYIQAFTENRNPNKFILNIKEDSVRIATGEGEAGFCMVV